MQTFSFRAFPVVFAAQVRGYEGFVGASLVRSLKGSHLEKVESWRLGCTDLPCPGSVVFFCFEDAHFVLRLTNCQFQTSPAPTPTTVFSMSTIPNPKSSGSGLLFFFYRSLNYWIFGLSASQVTAATRTSAGATASSPTSPAGETHPRRNPRGRFVS